MQHRKIKLIVGGHGTAEAAVSLWLQISHCREARMSFRRKTAVMVYPTIWRHIRGGSRDRHGSVSPKINTDNTQKGEGPVKRIAENTWWPEKRECWSFIGTKQYISRRPANSEACKLSFFVLTSTLCVLSRRLKVHPKKPLISRCGRPHCCQVVEQ